MNLRTTTRVSAVLGLVLAVAGAATLVAGPSASAATYDRIVIGEGETFSGEFGPILPANALANVDSSTAINVEICSTVPYCDVIPLTIREPRTFTPDEAEYYVKITLEWPSVVVENTPALGEVSATDLDLFIVNDPFDPGAGPDEDGFTYSSASQGNPEYFSMYAPAGDWHIIVDNYASTPTDYTLTVEWLTSRLPTPFESLPPTFSETGTVSPSPASPSLASPPSTQATPPAVFDAPASAPDLAPSNPPVADPTFSEGFDDDDGLSGAIAAPPTTVLDFEPSSADDTFPAPSGLSLILWLLAMPLLLVALVGWLLQRRHATDLAF